MHVFVAGATGVLGRRLVAALVDRGHDVTGLTRDERGDSAVSERGGNPVRGDVTDPQVVDRVGDADCVVHAASAVPTEKASAADWEHDARVRREGARHLAAAAADRDARYVGQSIAWVARPDGGGRVTGSDEPRPTRSTRAAADAERVALAEHPNPVLLRCGWYYGPEATHTRQLGERVAAGRMVVPGAGVFGRGDATLSYLHTADAARAFATAVEGDATGTYTVTDGEPATFAAFLRRLAAELGVSAPRRLPGWLLRPVLGADAVRLLTTDFVADGEAFRRAFDWTPTHDSIQSGLAAVVASWRADGTVREADEGVAWTDN